MIFTNDPIKILRIGIHSLGAEINNFALILDQDKLDEYKLDTIEFMRWLDEVEKFLYPNT